MKSPEMNRRSFLFSAAALVAGATQFLSARAWGQEIPAGKKALPESDAMAKALGYKEDATKADQAKYAQLKTPEGKKQKCNNCNFYTPDNTNWGKCQLLQNGLVNAQGWCASWVKKA